MASVILSEACRAKYSFSASLNKRLRDLLVLRASWSAPSKISSGIDTAVFSYRKYDRKGVRTSSFARALGSQSAPIGLEHKG